MIMLLTLFFSLLLAVMGSQSSSKSVEQFSFKINEHLYNENTTFNMIWSPLSVYLSLVPFLNAASGPTLLELETLLGIQGSQGFNNSTLTNTPSVNIDINDTKLDDTNVQICTGLFVQKDIKLKTKFSSSFNTVQTFENSTNLASTINAWMSNATHGLVPKVVENVKELAKLIVVNGVAFKGTWRIKFRKEKTLIKPFYGINNTSQVEMMQQKSTQNYGHFSTPDDEHFQVIKMGYKDSAMHLIIVLPQKTESLIKIYKFLQQVESNKLGEILERLEPTELEIQLPKMKVESRVDIQQALEKSGLKSVFSPILANLSNMFEEKSDINNSTTIGSHIDEFIHKTIFELDEEGTKAGAVTSATILPLSSFSPKEFVLDKPFIMFLRWEGKLTFFEGIVTDLPATSLTNFNLSQEATESKTAIEPQSSIVDVNNNNNHNETVSPSIARRNNSNEKWWVHDGPPEYLNESKSLPPQQQQLNDKFQKPEPSDPMGIRFPNPMENSTILKQKFMGTFHGEKINTFFVSQE